MSQFQTSNFYNFLYNSFNNVGDALNLQLNLFIAEIALKWAEMIIIIIIISVVYFLVNVIMYIVICKGFILISNKKASYISVFYGIDLSLIKSSIKKCEFFINKINQNDKNDKLRAIEEENSTIISTSNFNLNTNSFNKNKNETNHIKIKKNKNIGMDSRTKHFKIFLLIGLIISIIIFEIIVISIASLVNKFVRSAGFLYSMQRYHNNIIEMFNGYREFLFNENTTIQNKTVLKYLEAKEEEFYNTNMEDINTLNNLRLQITGLKEAIDNLNQKGLCNSYMIKYSSEEECEESVGGKNGILNFGFTFIINDFFEEMRYYRNIMNSFITVGLFHGDLNNLDEDYIAQINAQIKMIRTFSPFALYRLEIFNQIMHYDLVTKFLNIILQYILQEKDISTSYIEKYIDSGYIIYIVLISIFALIISGIFWIYWIPMIRVLNMEIYKTKNMLTIIPVQILASLPNIRELLNISNKR